MGPWVSPCCAGRGALIEGHVGGSLQQAGSERLDLRTQSAREAHEAHTHACMHTHDENALGLHRVEGEDGRLREIACMRLTCGGRLEWH